MIDPRIYRLAFAPALVALAILMFSVEPIPEPVRAPETFAADFDARRAAANTRRIVEAAPARTPGSEGDRAIAELVSARFQRIAAGKVSEQSFDGSFDGDGVELRNVLLTLPGNSEPTIIVVAGRDSARGSGATSSAAATGMLLEMAAELGRTRHEKTIVLVSTDAASEGARGMRELIESYPTPELVDGVVVISQPGLERPEPPHLTLWSVGAESSGAQLSESAQLALSEETGRGAGLGGFLGGLSRLALPAGLGQESVSIAEGLDAVAISGSGEAAPEPAEDVVAALSEKSLEEFGNATLALVLALDAAERPLAHGPDAHLELAGNLVPGWALGLLALALLLPALAVSVDGIARASRRREPAAGSLLWALSRSLPFLAVVVLAYLLALLGIAPDPAFPFDPGRFGLGWRAAGVLLTLLAAFAVLAIGLRALAAPPKPARETLATALGVVASVAVLGLWFSNPFLALVCVPLAHVWLLAARPAGPAGIAGTLAGVALALVPLLVALGHLAGRLGVGVEAPWTLVILLTGGQIDSLEALIACLLAGSVLGLLALALARRSSGGRVGGAAGSPIVGPSE